MIVSLLVIMSLLAVIMAVTAQITLSTRRSSVDQQELTQARYAAESGVARVQARLDMATTLLKGASLNPEVGVQSVEARMATLCGVSALPPFQQPGTICMFGPTGLRSGADTTNPRVQLLLDAIGADQFDSLGMTASTPQERTAFWSQLFSGAQGMVYAGGEEGTYQTQFGLRPLRVERTAENSYRIFFSVPPLTVQGTAGTSSQRMQARSPQTEYFILVSRPSFARYALFTNHHFSSPQDEAALERITFTGRTMFSGPVHTNQQFRFMERPWFGGRVTSAGCPAGNIVGAGLDQTCGVPLQRGAHFGRPPVFQTPAQMTSQTEPVFCNNQPDNVLCAQQPNRTAPSFGAGVQWDRDFIPLPDNANDQQGAAAQGGLSLTGVVDQLQLFQDTVNGQVRQRISYTQGATTVDLAFGADNRVWILSNGVWQPAQKTAGSFTPNPGGTPVTFNGVIAVQGSVTNLNGGPNANTGTPSVAAFARMTLAATADIAITSSLTYAQPPCSGQHTRNANGTVTPAQCGNTGATNMLGLFSSEGNIDLVSPDSCAAPCAALPANPNIHAVLMASQGAVRVRGHNAATNTPFGLGNINLVGGIIENFYGAFGITDGRGYGRNFVYDPRMDQGIAPPAFPTQRNWEMGVRALKSVAGQQTEVDVQSLRIQGDVVSTAGTP